MKSIDHIKDLKPDARNARSHNPRNIGMIVDSLHEVGAARSIVIDEHGRILAGNGTIEAAAEAGITKMQVVDADGETIVAVRRSGLTEAQKTRLALWDNRAAETADWDAGVLAAFAAEGVKLDDLFVQDELDAIIGTLDAPEPGDGGDDFDTTPEEGPTRVQPGDLWQLGPHRLLCGDSTKAEDVARLMGGEKADMVFTSPPYASQRKYDEDSGFQCIQPDEYAEWWELVQANIARHLKPNGSFFLNIKEHCEDGQRHLYVKDLTIATCAVGAGCSLTSFAGATQRTASPVGGPIASRTRGSLFFISPKSKASSFTHSRTAKIATPYLSTRQIPPRRRQGAAFSGKRQRQKLRA
jgi:hypothetical protein